MSQLGWRGLDVPRQHAGLGLPIAIDKLVSMASSADTAARLVSLVPKLEGSVKKAARNLGIDFTLGKRRVTAVATKRLKKVAKTAVANAARRLQRH